MFRTFTVLAACLFTSVGAVAQQTVDRPLLIGRVSLNQSNIAFTYAGKIWLVERTGGTAMFEMAIICSRSMASQLTPKRMCSAILKTWWAVRQRSLSPPALTALMLGPTLCFR